MKKIIEKAIDQNKLEKIVSALSDLEVDQKGRACIIWGGGSQTRFLYARFDLNEKVSESIQSKVQYHFKD